MNISFQGIEGSFHHEVAVGYFGQEWTWLGRDHFGGVYDDVAQGRAEYGVVAIENSNVGTIVGNLDHFDRVDVQIIAEVYLSVQQCLLIHPESTLKDLTEVRSHPMALDQCRAYLREKPAWTRVEVADTAGAAKWIMENGAKHVGAVGSALAGEVYEMSIAAHSIQQDATNQTRFWVIAKTGRTLQKPDDLKASTFKATVSFETSHETGALAEVLQAIKSNGWNLTKIESRPVPNVAWRYRFYCDMELDSMIEINELQSALAHLEQADVMESPHVLGAYGVHFF
ncbi:MAG: prephenate dehydratase [Balneolaceae bacterium]|nr:prephenate dehydratase [Balneolaceae bacterium]